TDDSRALAIYQAKLPADHLSVAHALLRVGESHIFFGRAEEGRVDIERAIAIYRSKLDAQDPRIAAALGGPGWAPAELGKIDEATAAWYEALAIEAHDQGGTTDIVAHLDDDLAGVALDRGRAREALSLAEHAVAIRGQLYGTEDGRVAESLT